MPTLSLTPQDLYFEAKLENLPCKSTKELSPIDEIVGQERAQKAVEFAMSIKEKGGTTFTPLAETVLVSGR